MYTRWGPGAYDSMHVLRFYKVSKHAVTADRSTFSISLTFSYLFFSLCVERERRARIRPRDPRPLPPMRQRSLKRRSLGLHANASCLQSPYYLELPVRRACGAVLDAILAPLRHGSRAVGHIMVSSEVVSEVVNLHFVSLGRRLRWVGPAGTFASRCHTRNAHSRHAPTPLPSPLPPTDMRQRSLERRLPSLHANTS